MASFLTAIDFAIVNTALPIIQKSLHASSIDLQWVMNIYVFTICISLVLLGRLADLYGRRKLLLLGVIVFGVASLMAGLAHTINDLIGWRLIQGIGSAAIIPSSLALLTDVLPLKLQSKGFGAWTAINGIGFAMGPVLGGVISQYAGWSWVFYINIPLVIISVLLILAVNETHRAHKEKIDWLGFISLAISIGALTLACIQAPLWGWLSRLTLGMLVIGAMAGCVFIAVGKRSQMPLLPLSLFANLRYLAAVIANSTPVLLAYVIFFFVPLFLHQVKGLSVSLIGWLLVPTTLSMVVVSPLVSRIMTANRVKYIITGGMLCLVVAVISMATLTPASSIGWVVLAGSIFGLGWGVIWGSATQVAMSCVPAKQAGVASAGLWTVQNMVGCLGLAITGSLFHLHYISSFVRQVKAHGLLGQLAGSHALLWHDPEKFSVVGVTSDIKSILVHSYQQAFTAGFTAVMFLLFVILLVAIVSFFYLYCKSDVIKKL